MSIKGFKLSDGTVEKYDFPYLDNIDVQLQHLGSDVRAVLNNKADIDGSYINLNAGTANNLNSSVGIEDSAPYNFRTSGGSTEIGDREKLNAVVGVSVPWNQFAPSVESDNYDVTSGATLTFLNGVATIHVDAAEGTQKAFVITNNKRKKSVIGHKYLFVATVQTQNGLLALLPTGTTSHGLLNYAQYSTKSILSYIWSAGVEAKISASFEGYTGGASISSAIDFTVEKVNVFDLTLQLGSTIADYVYTLESGTAGAGVAWLKKYGYFTKPYYPYAAANLQSVKTNAHITYGFNAYDNSTGKAKVVGGMVYQITGAYTALSLDGTSITPDANGYFTPSVNGELTVTGGNGTTTCIHLKWDGERDGEYEPYVAHEYALDDITLRGILKLDANNNLYADGDRYLPDGTVERRYGIVDLGTLDWTLNSSYTHNTFYSDYLKNNSLVYTTTASVGTAICPKYVQLIGNVNATAVGNNTTDKVFCIASSGTVGRIAFADDSYSDATAFKSAMDGVYLVYELATPTTETADPYQQTQIVDDFGTEEFVDAAVEANERDVAIPVGHETFYQNNLKAKLEMAPNSPDGDGLYVVQQILGENTYVPLVVPNEIPDAPTTDGTYVLKASVSDGTVTYSWVAE